MHMGHMFKGKGKKEVHGERNCGMSGKSGVRNGYAWRICGVEREKVVRKKYEGLERGMGLRGCI